jgi:hypothetical protein
MMHSKQKGNIGVAATVLELQKHGLSVFSELGDYSRIDLIAELHGELKSIQVKYAKNINGIITIPLRKCGPNGYRYTYKTSDIDWFAIYDPSSEKVYWVKSDEALANKTGFALRTIKPKNNQCKNINLAENYMIDGFLRDYTRNT